MDSNKKFTSAVSSYQDHFTKLHTIASAAAASGRMQTVKCNWNLVLANDVPQQKDGSSCGIFVVAYACAIANQISLRDADQMANVAWINNTLREYDAKKLDPIYENDQHILRIPNDIVQELALGVVLESGNQDFYVAPIGQIMQDLIGAQQENWTTCCCCLLLPAATCCWRYLQR